MKELVGFIFSVSGKWDMKIRMYPTIPELLLSFMHLIRKLLCLWAFLHTYNVPSTSEAENQVFVTWA